MRVGSLFAGIGGFDLGMERAGFRTLWQVESHPSCASILARHFPEAQRFGDIREVDPKELAPVDIVCGGFPCQDLSVAGHRAGLAGARSGLFYRMMEVVDGLRPSWVLWENVPGLLSSAPEGESRGSDFLAVLAELDRLGFAGAWTTLDARHFGLAQRRARVFGLFTSRGAGARSAAEVLSLAARMSGRVAPGRKAREGAAPGSGRAAEGGGLAYTLKESDGRRRGGGVVVPDLAWALQERDGKGPDSSTKDGHLIPFDLKHITLEGRTDPLPGDPSPTISQTGRVAVADLPALADPITAAEARTYTHEGRGNFRMRNVVPDYAGTLRSNPRNNSDPVTEARSHLYDGVGVRRLTPLECERLQGFPDGWTATGCQDEKISDSRRYAGLGNAAPPPFSYWIAKRLQGLA